MAPKKQPANRSGAAKSAAKSPKSKSAAKKPVDSFFGWMGRQVGHVKKAVQTDVTKPTGKKPASGATANKTSPKAKASGPSPANQTRPTAKPTTSSAVANEKIIYRHDEIEEAEIPHRPGVILRRTIIDEVVVETTETTEAEPKDVTAK